jgi:hypothetical protein
MYAKTYSTGDSYETFIGLAGLVRAPIVLRGICCGTHKLEALKT